MSKPAGTHKRWFLWLPLLLVGGWLALFGDKSPAGDAAVSLPAKPQTAPMSAQPIAGAPVERPRAAPLEPTFALVPRDQLFAKAGDTASAEKKAARDLFSTRSWNPPPPPPPPEQPAPPPVAPPLPYAFLGKKLEGDTWEVFLSKSEQTFVAREGQVLENAWRVDKIAPPTLTLTYLPLGLPQTLSIGDPR
ncbi:hypothetical protein [Ramlibacter sp. WS9]|uniref:hypothetical protein n=1 Tax=Ramlibacter sp. WS9 TaxID=1882741 RepID=UPI001143D8D6|nr:hypothetical protein [Ramlibacter sp. WS9]ROZ79741.1 hypothetical protein EEB15_02225 [Ramlibacter sp. WS9]